MDSEKEKLYAMLFRSFKANFGIDFDAESRDPVKDFLNRYDRGEYDPPMMSVVVAYMRGNRENFLKNYPEELRNYLWEVCRNAMNQENEKKEVLKDLN